MLNKLGLTILRVPCFERDGLFGRAGDDYLSGELDHK
jgi:hypothetical protein